ncbi:MAG: hypothetical protein ACI4PK_04145 [Oscillospiraceae bacterium]
MKFNIMKKLFSIVLSTWFTFGCISLTEISAGFEDIEFQGGSYDDVLNEKRIYQEQKPDDKTAYKCHHLIAKEALNLWRNHITKDRKLKSNVFNEFLVDDLEQNWAPTIIMEKADHEQTLSYFNSYTRTQRQNEKASAYINSQAMRIIFYGILLEF